MTEHSIVSLFEGNLVSRQTVRFTPEADGGVTFRITGAGGESAQIGVDIVVLDGNQERVSFSLASGAGSRTLELTNLNGGEEYTVGLNPFNPWRGRSTAIEIVLEFPYALEASENGEGGAEDPSVYIPDTLDLEYAARIVAYQRNGSDGYYDLPEGYRLEAPIVSENGFFAVPIVSDNGQPILAVRGTTNIADILTNIDARGIGAGQVEAATLPLALWLSNNPDVHITGHSLGGAQAQIIAAEVSAGTLGSSASVTSVTTFNAPGVSTATAEKFDAENIASVRHFVAAGDLVSKAGNVFLPGEVTLYHFDSLDGADPNDFYGLILTQVMNAHTGHWAQPSMIERGFTDYALPAGFDVFPDTFMVEQLSAPEFSYLSFSDDVRGITYRDADYDLMLSLMSPSLIDIAMNYLGPELGHEFDVSQTFLIRGIGRSLENRHTVERLRSDIGSIEEVGSFVYEFFSGSFVAPLAAISPGLGFGAFLGSNLFSRQNSDVDITPQSIQVANNIDTELGTGFAGSIYVSGPGVTTTTMTGGSNTVFGHFSDLDGDRIHGFGNNDQIIVSGFGLMPSNISITLGSAIISIDENGDGTADATFRLEGDFDLSAFTVLEDPDGVRILYEGEGFREINQNTDLVEVSGVVANPAGDALLGVAVTFITYEGAIEAELSDSSGRFGFDMDHGLSGHLSAERDYNPETDGSISARDALEVLRLSVGLSPSWGPASPMDFIAADFNQDGQVTAADALGVLRAAVDPQNATQPRWIFLDSKADLQGIDRTNTDIEHGIVIEPFVAGLTEVSMTGVLLGSMQEYA